MPMHDWTRVDAGIFHAFHSEWISQINRALLPLLPEGYYCLPEQQAAGFGPDILTLQESPPDPVEKPVEATYNRAWEIVPPRWRRVIDFAE